MWRIFNRLNITMSMILCSPRCLYPRHRRVPLTRNRRLSVKLSPVTSNVLFGDKQLTDDTNKLKDIALADLLGLVIKRNSLSVITRTDVNN